MPTLVRVRRPKHTHGLMRYKKIVRDGRPIHELREKKMRLSRTVFARLLKVSENTIFRWETGRVKPDPRSSELLTHLNRLCDVILPSMDPKDVGEWLEKPNKAIENFRPIDLIEFEYGRQKLKALIEETGIHVTSF